MPSGKTEMTGVMSWLRGLRMDVAPLRAGADFRALFASRTITLLGSQAGEVALLIQAKQLTGSALDVGLLGAVELVPLMVFGLYGGVLADRLDRRALARWSEAGLGCFALILMVNAALARPAVWPLYVVAAGMTALVALQRPSLDAAVPRIVPRDQLTAAMALVSLSSNASFIIGSAIGGILAAGPGPMTVYAADAASFAVSFVLLSLLRPLPAPEPEGRRQAVLPSLLTGLRYARSRQELVGSYLLDLAAMGFAYPASLFPFMAATLHAQWAAGLMFSAESVGAIAASVVSGWAARVHRHGAAIAVAAAAWGAAIAGFGFAPSIGIALACLVAAGAADMVSGIFRATLWNQTIPDELRGRLAGVEVLSYTVGPSAGQVRAGAVAGLTTARVSAWSGGLLCVAAVGVITAVLPAVRRYTDRPISATSSSQPSESSSRS